MRELEIDYKIKYEELINTIQEVIKTFQESEEYSKDLSEKTDCLSSKMAFLGTANGYHMSKFILETFVYGNKGWNKNE